MQRIDAMPATYNLRGRLLTVVVVITVGWMLLTHVIFLVTGDVGEFWIEWLPGVWASEALVAWLFVQYFLLPVGVLVCIRFLGRWADSPARFALIAGGLAGLWVNTEALGVPYCGAYTSLPALMVVMLLHGGTMDDQGFVYLLLAANLVMWMFIAWCFGWVRPLRRWLVAGELP